MLKKILLSALASCLLFSTSFHEKITVKAEESNIFDYVISGSGTFDDPYILSGNNIYKKTFDAIAKESLQPSTMNIVDFSHGLTGKSYSNQINGGKWTYISGGLDVNTDNSLLITNISYAGKNELNDLVSVCENKVYYDMLNSFLIANVYGKALDAALASSVGVSCASNIASIFFFIADVVSAQEKNLIFNAFNSNLSILNIQYKTSYHGSWYLSNCIDTWRNFPTATTPASYLGNGKYTSNI